MEVKVYQGKRIQIYQFADGSSWYLHPDLQIEQRTPKGSKQSVPEDWFRHILTLDMEPLDDQD